MDAEPVGEIMGKIIETDLCIIGGGSGGLSLAAGAVQMGAKVVLFERHKMGGDCLNYGCVPSKAMLAAGQASAGMRDASRFGIHAPQREIDFEKVHQHIHGVIGEIAHHDSVERFESLGVQVLDGDARFVNGSTVTTANHTVRAKRIVVATGSRPAVPPIPGLHEVPYLTNETIFDLKEAPTHLIVIGGGAIGCELAQAHRRLGCKVSLLELATILPKDDLDLVSFVRSQLRDDGVVLRERTQVKGVQNHPQGVSVTVEEDGTTETVSGSHVLIATGRVPNLEGLKLEKAGVAYEKTGITVDARLRTTNRRVFAIGDCAGGMQFTHVAGYHAGIVIRNVLFKIPAKADHAPVPWVTFTSPELGQVGLTATQARERYGDTIKVLKSQFAENDRAQAELKPRGMIKVVVDRRGRVLGCGIVGPHAGELMLPWVMAVKKKMKIGEIAQLIAPYPTLSEISKRVAGSYFTDSLYGNRTKKLVRFMLRFA